jgi:hypothetical protein
LIKPISNIVIRDKHDIYTILTNREKLECLLQEYENNYLEEQEVCYDEKSPCVPDHFDNLNNKKIVSSVTTTAITQEPLVVEEGKKHEEDYSHRGKISHSKNTDEQSVKEMNIEHLKPDPKSKIKEELEKSHREQLIMLKENKTNIINFLLSNKDSIRIEDLKIYEPIYKCYRQKGNCHICNSLSNIICINCNPNYNNEETWLCTNHWQKHAIESHNLQWIK